MENSASESQESWHSLHQVSPLKKIHIFLYSLSLFCLCLQQFPWIPCLPFLGHPQSRANIFQNYSGQLSLSHLPPLSAAPGCECSWRQLAEWQFPNKCKICTCWPLNLLVLSLEKAPTCSSLDQALWNEVGAAGKKFLTRGEMGSAVLCALGGVTLSPRDGQTIPSSSWSTEVIPGAALRSVLFLPHKRLKEQCNYARESAALRYENRRG